MKIGTARDGAGGRPAFGSNVEGGEAERDGFVFGGFEPGEPRRPLGTHCDRAAAGGGAGGRRNFFGDDSGFGGVGSVGGDSEERDES